MFYHVRMPLHLAQPPTRPLGVPHASPPTPRTRSTAPSLMRYPKPAITSTTTAPSPLPPGDLPHLLPAYHTTWVRPSTTRHYSHRHSLFLLHNIYIFTLTFIFLSPPQRLLACFFLFSCTEASGIPSLVEPGAFVQDGGSSFFIFIFYGIGFTRGCGALDGWANL